MAAPLIRFPRAEIQELIVEITDAPVIWSEEPEPFLGVQNGKAAYWIELSIIATATKGVDEDRLEYDPINEVNDTTQISYRIYTMTVRVKSFSKDTPAFDVIDQVRRGLRSVTAKQQYTEIGIAFVDWGKTVDLKPAADNRLTSESTLDVRIAWQVSADPGDNDGGWIETVASNVNGLTP